MEASPYLPADLDFYRILALLRYATDGFLNDVSLILLEKLWRFHGSDFWLLCGNTISLSLQGSSNYPDASLAVVALDVSNQCLSLEPWWVLLQCYASSLYFVYVWIYSIFIIWYKGFFWCNFNTQYAITYEYSVNLLILFPHMDSVDSSLYVVLFNYDMT